MSRKKRGLSSAPFPLFSFQDIITCLSGIMIFFVLFLAIQVAQMRIKPLALPHNLKTEKSKTDTAKINSLKTQAKHLLSTVQQIKQDTQLIKEKIMQQQSKQKELLHNIKQKQHNLNKQKESNHIYYKFNQKPSKHPYLVLCTRTKITVRSFDSGALLKTINLKYFDYTPFLEYIAVYIPRQTYFVFIIKPSAADYAMPLVNYVWKKGYDIGYEALDEQKTAVIWSYN